MLKPFLVTATVAMLSASVWAAPDSQSPPVPAKARPTSSGLMRYDANGDGVVDQTEWIAGQEARFKQLDADKDGKLSQDELFSRTPASGGGVLPTDRQADRQSAYFRRLDSDRDGSISKTEFMTQANRNFARCDLNKDGHIDTAECRQALRRTPVSAQPAGATRQ